MRTTSGGLTEIYTFLGQIKVISVFVPTPSMQQYEDRVHVLRYGSTGIVQDRESIAQKFRRIAQPLCIC